MSSTAQAVFLTRSCRVEVHVLPSIFNIGKLKTNPESQGPVSRFLINSANEYLIGTSLPYFPRGGLQRQPNNIFASPEDWQKSSSWGGLSVGEDLLFPVQVLDGEVHQRLGGRQSELKKWIAENVPAVDHVEHIKEQSVRALRDPQYDDKVKCTTGDVVWTPAFPTDLDLQRSFSLGILHTVSPYHDTLRRDELLHSCYTKCLKLAAIVGVKEHEVSHITTALLGTGVKNIEPEDSARALAKSVRQHQGDDGLVVELVVQPTRDVELRIKNISRVFVEEFEIDNTMT